MLLELARGIYFLSSNDNYDILLLAQEKRGERMFYSLHVLNELAYRFGQVQNFLGKTTTAIR